MTDAAANVVQFTACPPSYGFLEYKRPEPRYLLNGPKNQSAGERLLAPICAATTDDLNVFTNKPRITDYSWFLFADPARLAALQYDIQACREA
jgi:hypothetical protein